MSLGMNGVVEVIDIDDQEYIPRISLVGQIEAKCAVVLEYDVVLHDGRGQSGWFHLIHFASPWLANT